MNPSRFTWLAASTSALMLALPACTPMQPVNNGQAEVANAIGMSAGSAHNGTTKEWMQIDSPHRTVAIRLVAGANGQLLLNGYANGAMTISVPQRWKVRLTFQNNSRVAMYRPVIVPYSERDETRGLHAVYPPKPGIMKPSLVTAGHSDTEQFTANQTGRFVIITARDQTHRSLWANFVVSAHEPTPRIYVRVGG